MKTKVYKENQIKDLIDDLKADHIVALATDTVMGLAAKASSKEAFEKLKQIKERPDDKPFPIMVSNFDQLSKIIDLNKRNEALVKSWFPGAVTFIFNKKANANLIGIGQTIAVRMPNDKVILEVVNSLQEPIFLTSANKSNQPTTKKAKDSLEIFGGKIKSILMKDALGYMASTIVDATSDDLKILRSGEISLKEILESLEE